VNNLSEKTLLSISWDQVYWLSFYRTLKIWWHPTQLKGDLFWTTTSAMLLFKTPLCDPNKPTNTF